MSSNPPTEPARSHHPIGWSLRARLVAIMISMLAVLGLVVGATAEIYLHKTLYDQIDATLAETSDFAVNPRGPGRPGGFDETRPPPNAEENTIVLRLSASGTGGGTLEFRTGSEGYDRRLVPVSATAAAELAAVAPTGEPTDVTLSELGDYRVMSVVAPDGDGVVAAAVPLAETQSTLAQVALFTGGAVVVALIIAGWGGAVIVRRNLRPLERVAATATRVSELRLDQGEVDLAQRVPEADTDPGTEVGQVGAALNRMLDHVGNALEVRHHSEMRVRQFVADASHELRTPLAAIRGYAELSRRTRQPVPDEVGHLLRRVESEAQRMTALVEDLLLLARLDAGRPLAQDPVDLTMLVVDAVSDAHAAGPGHDWQLGLPVAPVPVIGDRARLHQVLANLLANARTHTPEGTTVTVGVHTTADQALIKVTDTGPGIPADLQPHVFERFARGDSSRSRAAGSTGLGLSIVHAVVTAHDGTVSVDSVAGRTEFTVRLPLRPAGPPVPAGRPRATVRRG
ncbi:MAG TPA: HAMP domain-containing sensor histidine kinase [Actinoplanes sp.]|nr:HAMP domain-containing sensor histidine kinase [Actinoplanes sp.]